MYIYKCVHYDIYICKLVYIRRYVNVHVINTDIVYIGVLGYIYIGNLITNNCDTVCIRGGAWRKIFACIYALCLSSCRLAKPSEMF